MRAGQTVFVRSKTRLMKKSRKSLWITALVVLAAGAGIWKSLQPNPVRVSVIAVERGDVTQTVSNTRAGTVKACRRSGLSAAVGGNIASLPVKEGDHVTQGQVLLELWNRDLRAELLRSKRDAVASNAKAREACVRAEVAERESERLKRLLEQNLSSVEETDSAEGDALALAAGCSAARDLAKVSEARIQIALEAVERSILRAPFDGVIAEINGELGEFVTPSPVGVATPPTVDLIDSTCLYISAPIDEVDAPAVQSKMRAVVTMDAFPDRQFSGFVRRVAPYVLDVEKQARTVEVEAEIDDPGQSVLLPGYSADVEITLSVRKNVLNIPTQAILEKRRVFVLDEQRGIIEERSIKAGVANWEQTEILSGLDEGELVVLSVDREGVEDGALAVRE